MRLIDVQSPKDIKNLSVEELKSLNAQMRQAILEYTSTVGGHVGPNLGDVEALTAVHYVFDAPKDKIVIDVSHQDFVHKMLTGRAEYYLDPNRYAAIGEYTDPKESPQYDLFYAGHTSPSISLAFGLAKARELKGETHNIVVFIGDGSLSGGMAFEGLDAAAELDANFIVIVNDNQMAIAENHGGLYRHLQALRETNGQAENNIFKALGYDYLYVAEGNDLTALITALQSVKDSRQPVIVHINTQKGEGYAPAEARREEFHSHPPFDLENGETLSQSNLPDYSKETRDFLLKKVKENPELLIVSSATPETFGFMAKERKACGRQFIDVAIAEQTAVSALAGACRGGVKVVYPVAATFLQRAFDQLIEDWGMNEGAGVLLVFESGIKGIKDETHLGFWDIPMITAIPNLVYLAPTGAEEYLAMLDWAIGQDQYKVAIRVPTYSYEHNLFEVDDDYGDINRFQVVKTGSQIAVIAAGDFFAKGLEVVKELETEGIEATLINPRFLSGVDRKLLKELEKSHRLVVVLEDGSKEGGFGTRIAQAAAEGPMKCLTYGMEKKFVDRYDIATLETQYRLNAHQIVEDIQKAFA